MKKIIAATLFAFLTVATHPQSILAHVVVKPSEAKIGQFMTFTMGVPPEKNIPTTSVRLVIPEGLEYVRPTVKSGWKIDIKKQGTGEDAKVTEITWSNGSIPPDQRDEFSFSAKVPTTATELNWKAYQTYSDGSVVAWDQTPKKDGSHDDDFSKMGPYSVTKVIDDLSANTTTAATESNQDKQNQTSQPATKANSTTEWISYAALMISVIALGLSFRK